MSDQAQTELLHGLASAVAVHLKEAALHRQKEHQSMARVAVALLQLSARYFAETGAPPAVINDFVRQVFGLEGMEAQKIKTIADRLVKK